MDARAAAIAYAILSLCANQGLSVPAKGIERIPQLKLLLGFGPILRPMLSLAPWPAYRRRSGR
jgi:hypothetical protein